MIGNLSNNHGIEVNNELLKTILSMDKEDVIMRALARGVSINPKFNDNAFMISAFEIISHVIKK